MFPLTKEGWITVPHPNGHCAEPGMAVLLEVWEGERSLDFVVAGMASDYREGSLCLG